LKFVKELVALTVSCFNICEIPFFIS